LKTAWHRDGQFDNAQPGAQVTAGHRDGRDRFIAQFFGHLLKVFRLQLSQVSRILDGVKQRS
jgi:hypothetical protein